MKGQTALQPTVKGGDAGTGGWAGGKRGIRADVDGAGDIKAASYIAEL